MYSGASVALVIIDFLKLCICASQNSTIPAWQGWPPSSTSRASVEASRGLLMCWVILKQSEAKITDWLSMEGHDDHGDRLKSPVMGDGLIVDVTWTRLKKAMQQVKETAYVGYTEAPSHAVFG